MSAPAAAMADDGKAIVQGFVRDFWNGRNFGLADAFISPEYVRYENGWDTELRGPNGLRQGARKWLSIFPDMYLTIENMLCDGDKVGGTWTLSGTHIGPLHGVAPTGRIVKVSGMFIATITSGKIVREDVFSDVWGLMKQLSATPY